ncbi:MAG: hypothetical protein WDW36_000138 [Sanguina aurantia]
MCAPTRYGIEGDSSFRADGKPALEKERQVLFDVSGAVQPGEVLALMGPSGSGKTSLLAVMGGRSTARSSGSITFNGEPPNKAIKRKMGFVAQDDLLFAELTVFETLYFAAMLRLPSTLPKAEKVARVELVINVLGLSKCRDTIIGGGGMRGVSGGERKRVSVGHELLTNPSVIFLDECTSGLDSTNALKLMQTLSTLAAGGRTIVTSIHQPSGRLYLEMDKLLLLAEGRTMFFGDATAAAGWFEVHRQPCPHGVNIADHILDCANGSPPSTEGVAAGKVVAAGLLEAFDERTVGGCFGGRLGGWGGLLGGGGLLEAFDERTVGGCFGGAFGLLEAFDERTVGGQAGRPVCRARPLAVLLCSEAKACAGLPVRAPSLAGASSGSRVWRCSHATHAWMHAAFGRSRLGIGGILTADLALLLPGSSEALALANAHAARFSHDARRSVELRRRCGLCDGRRRGDGVADERGTGRRARRCLSPGGRGAGKAGGPGVLVEGEEEGSEGKGGAEGPGPGGKWGATFSDQVGLLLVRSLKVRRFSTLSTQKVLMHVVIAGLAGCYWFQLGVQPLKASVIHDMAGLLFFIVLFMSFANLFNSLMTFPPEFQMLVKERQSGMYRLSAYYIARTSSELPVDCLLPSIFYIILYFMTGLRLDAGAFFANWATLLLIVLVAQSVGLLLGAMVQDATTAWSIANVLTLGLMLVGGFYVQAMPVWISWVKYISWIRWGFNLTLKIEYRHRGMDCGSLPPAALAAYTASGSTAPCFVSQSGALPIDVDEPVYPEVLILLGMLFALRVAVLEALRMKTTFTKKTKSKAA